MYHISPRHHTIEHSPYTPSPLALGNPNACPRFFTHMRVEAKSDARMLHHPSKRSPHNLLPQRKPEEVKAERRQVFLKKVRQARDDKRWESRSDEILRRDFLTRRKEWEEAQIISAPEAPSGMENEGEPTPWSNTSLKEQFGTSPQLGSRSSMTEAEIVEQVILQEDQEFEALVSLLQESNQAVEDRENVATDYGSDEEDYDRLFIEVMTKEGITRSDPEGSQEKAPNRDQDMDMSLG